MSGFKPYPANTNWTWTLRQRGGNQWNEPLNLQYEISMSLISDNWTPNEISARELWDRYYQEYVNYGADQYPKTYAPGEVGIFWYVIADGTFEGAPFQDSRRMAPDARPGDFMSYYTWPVHAVTGERINWLRVPVLDQQWNARRADRGGFIQEVTGWKPSPLQPKVDLHMLAAAAGLAPAVEYLRSIRDEY